MVASQATTVGIGYVQHQLTLEARSMDHTCPEVVEAVKRIAGFR